MAEKGGEAPARIFCTKYETKQCLVKKVVQVAWIERGGGRKFGPEDNIFAGGDPLGFLIGPVSICLMFIVQQRICLSMFTKKWSLFVVYPNVFTTTLSNFLFNWKNCVLERKIKLLSKHPYWLLPSAVKETLSLLSNPYQYAKHS